MGISSCYCSSLVPSGLDWARVLSTQFERFDCPRGVSQGDICEAEGLVTTWLNWLPFRPVSAEKVGSSRVKSGKVGRSRAKSGEVGRKKTWRVDFCASAVGSFLSTGYLMPGRLHDFRSSLYHDFFLVRVLFSVVKQNRGGKGQLGRLKVCSECVGQDFSYVCWESS